MTKIRDLWNEDGYLIRKDGDCEERLSVPGMAVADMDTPCPTCAKLIGDHEPEEIDACSKPSSQP